MGPPSLRWILQKQFSLIASSQTGHFWRTAPLNCTARGPRSSDEFILLLCVAVGRSRPFGLSVRFIRLGDHFRAGWSCQASAYSTLRTTATISGSVCIGLLGKGFEFGQNGLLGGGADDAQTRISSHEIEEGWNGLNVVPKTQVETIIGINLDHFDLACTGAR